MTDIIRQPGLAAQQPHDLLIIGAGIYGIALALTASQCGLRTLLLEKQDFGWATSYNSLRTLHGGLRYLQTLDIKRFFESVAERRWFMQEFPGLVQPLPCLMPLYGNGPYRPSVFRVALALNDFLSGNRNKGVVPNQQLPDSRVISRDEVLHLFPAVDPDGLRGGALWYDGAMPSSQLILMEMLRRACARTTTALNYMAAEELLVEDGQVYGVRARDLEDGHEFRFRAATVVNAAGPWCRQLAAGYHTDKPELFRYSIAWNALFNRPALSGHSLAVKPKRAGARMYFLHGWNNRLMGGTVHAPWPGPEERPMPGRQAINDYLADLNLAIPGLNLQPGDILHIYSGLLPAREQGSDRLAVREVILDHGIQGGPRGAYTVSGVKFTTARKVAEKTLRTIFPHLIPLSAGSIRKRPAADLGGQDGIFPYYQSVESMPDWQQRLQRIIASQAVLHLDDLLLRRTSIGDNPQRALAAAPRIAELFPWDTGRIQQELQRLHTSYLPQESGS